LRFGGFVGRARSRQPWLCRARGWTWPLGRLFAQRRQPAAQRDTPWRCAAYFACGRTPPRLTRGLRALCWARTTRHRLRVGGVAAAPSPNAWSAAPRQPAGLNCCLSYSANALPFSTRYQNATSGDGDAATAWAPLRWTAPTACARARAVAASAGCRTVFDVGSRVLSGWRLLPCTATDHPAKTCAGLYR